MRLGCHILHETGDERDDHSISSHGRQDLENPDAITISGIVFKGPNIRAIFFKTVQEIITEKFQAPVFKMPKTAVAAHEAGHIVVGHSLGFHIENARLFKDPPGSDIWSGITYAYYEQLPIAELLLRRARMIYAGQVAETFVKTEFQYLAISSIEELLASRGIVTDSTRWDEDVHQDVLDRLKRNQEPFRRIATILFAEDCIGGSPLQEMLGAVQIDL